MRFHKALIGVVAVAAAGLIYTNLPKNTCHARGYLPDPVCTPGVADSRITQANINSTICVKGYTKTVRPSVMYTDHLKNLQIVQYGYADTNPKDYEEDHFIPLELAGSPTDPKNLWPESYSGTEGARMKDKVENKLHKDVCNGLMTLQQAQSAIEIDWTKVP